VRQRSTQMTRASTRRLHEQQCTASTESSRVALGQRIVAQQLEIDTSATQRGGADRPPSQGQVTAPPTTPLALLRATVGAAANLALIAIDVAARTPARELACGLEQQRRLAGKQLRTAPGLGRVARCSTPVTCAAGGGRARARSEPLLSPPVVWPCTSSPPDTYTVTLSAAPSRFGVAPDPPVRRRDRRACRRRDGGDSGSHRDDERSRCPGALIVDPPGLARPRGARRPGRADRESPRNTDTGRQVGWSRRRRRRTPRASARGCRQAGVPARGA
jgi:hypothetical protein